jgi:hypothetical protein
MTSFPYDAYFQLLANTKLTRPRAVMPGSCGFKYLGEAAWLNGFVFPSTREAFQRDVRRLLPDASCMIVNPGDVLAVEASGTTPEPGQSPFVAMTRDDSSETAFNPTGPVPELRDRNPSGYGAAETRQIIEEYLHRRLVPVLQGSLDRKSLAYEYGSIDCVYELDVVFPHETVSWFIAFGEPPLRMRSGAGASPNIRAQITASALSDVILGRRGPNYVHNGGFYRWFSRLYVVEGHGLYPWKPMSEKVAADPLWFAIDVQDAFVKYVNREISRHGEHRVGAAVQ